jgi:tRNA dimethylallyltransferase
MTKTVIIVAGPTAAGKTGIAIKLAKQLGTEIISADSRQCYSELNIGVAKPSKEELASVPHYFIDSHSIFQPVNAAMFEQYALDAVSKIFASHDTAVMVGGTGLYIKAFCEGLNEIPVIPEELRTDINKNYDELGLGWLQEQIRIKDPKFADGEDFYNPHRLMRALEVVITTGRSIRHFQTHQKAERNFKIKKYGIAPPKEVLHQQINDRVDKMIADGLVDEVRALINYRDIINTVGYDEIFEYLDGKVSLETAIENIKVHTRQYAKRQMTWFRKDEEIKWELPSCERGR